MYNLGGGGRSTGAVYYGMYILHQKIPTGSMELIRI